VPFPYEVKTDFVTSLSKRRGKLSGYADIEITTVDNLYIGSGFSEFRGNCIVSQTQTIIPASSLKGAVRQVARASSEACIPMNKIQVPVLYNGETRIVQDHGRRVVKYEYSSPRVTENQKHHCVPKPDEDGNIQVCIVCDMFGAMSLGSKVRFTDMQAEKCSLVQLPVPQQFSPSTATSNYWDLDDHKNAVYYGYKFYYTDCEPRDLSKNESIEAVSKNVTFKGRVFFKDLFEKQLQLLMFSLGVGKHISLKLGGYKADGFGTVKTRCTQLMVNNKETDAKALADKYASDNDDIISPPEMVSIKDILKYRER